MKKEIIKCDERRYHMSHEEIGATMGLSRSRIQQIEKRALAKVRRAFQTRGYTFQNLTPED